jgi:hypothetical protein
MLYRLSIEIAGLPALSLIDYLLHEKTAKNGKTGTENGDSQKKYSGFRKKRAIFACPQPGQAGTKKVPACPGNPK